MPRLDMSTDGGGPRQFGSSHYRGSLAICGRPLSAEVRISRGLIAWPDAAICLACDAPPWRCWPVWEFADRVQITHSVLEALWRALVLPAPSHRLCAIPSFVRLPLRRLWS